MPWELIAGVGSGIIGFLMKGQANQQANTFKLAEQAMKANSHASGLADAAAKRSSPWIRKFAAVMILTIGFGGLLLVAFFSEIPVSIVEHVPQKSLLWGLIKWGKESEVITAEGFVLPQWFGYTINVVVGFLFGTGAAKPAR
ncbi:hypothetical protein PDESU_03295 [Pontiella desulfatans]|uniref:Uncharacterized protein n=1 Tax=Pontiella desulfatans TaxID=2750659 RepID=A0A6C2U5P8_PONDE|nr:hypothetical protein [Pontiella desulfatans]VGO14726.1 hypothetical protein PDESU_03295 [Pontiella desulfatans]